MGSGVHVRHRMSELIKQELVQALRFSRMGGRAGLSQKELAKMLGVSRQTFNSRLQKGRAALVQLEQLCAAYRSGELLGE
jgi:DNA-binding XRE family transcriptional regulator